MINTLVRFVYILLALMIPGGFVFVALSWVFKGLQRRYQIPRPKGGLPVRNAAGNVIFTEADWESHAREEFPLRYWLTIGLPRASRRAREALKRVFRRPTPSEQLLGASFDVLVRYVRTKRGAWVLQNPPQGYDDDPLEAERWAKGAELWSLYEWWTVDRGRQRRVADEAADPRVRDQYRHSQREIDNLMLNRLTNACESMN